MKTKLKWFCKHFNCSGEIELEDGIFRGSDINKLIKEQHDKVCKIGGETWVVQNFPEYCKVYLDNNVLHMAADIRKDDFPHFAVLHIQ